MNWGRSQDRDKKRERETGRRRRRKIVRKLLMDGEGGKLKARDVSRTVLLGEITDSSLKAFRIK